MSSTNQESKTLGISSEWSRFGKKYDVGGKPPTADQMRPALENHVFPQLDALNSGLDNSEELKVLDVACGTGAELGIFLEHYGPNGKTPSTRITVTATDVAQGMLDAASNVIQEHNAEEMVKLQLLDAQSMDIPSSSFHVVLFFLGPHILADSKKGISEIYRVLKPAGFAAFVTPKAANVWDVFGNAKRDIIQSRQSGVTGLGEKLPNNISEMPTIKSWADLDTFKAKVADEGFERIYGATLQAQTKAEDYSLLLDSLLENPGMLSFARDLTDTEQENLKAKIREAFAQTSPDGKTWNLDFAFNFVMAYKPSSNQT